MIQRNPRNRAGHRFEAGKRHGFRGLTLVEVMIVAALSSVIFLFMAVLMRNVGQGMLKTQRHLPLQRDIQLVQQVVQKDLLSSIRSTLGNSVPTPGFEVVPTRLSTFTPVAQGEWSCVPQVLRKSPLTYGLGSITAHPAGVRQGHYGLLVNFQTNGSETYFAQSGAFPLVAGQDYLFGGWVESRRAGTASSLRLLGDPTPWPSTVVATLSSASSGWTFVVSTFTATVTFNYRVQAGSAGGSNVGVFDDLIVLPLVSELTPANGRIFDFEIFEANPLPQNQRTRVRYRVVPSGTSGRLLREKVLPGGTVENAGDFDRVRRLVMGWDFGEAQPGALPATWSSGFFGNGMNFPLRIILEVGDVGAPVGSFLSLDFSVFPEVP